MRDWEHFIHLSCWSKPSEKLPLALASEGTTQVVLLDLFCGKFLCAPIRKQQWPPPGCSPSWWKIQTIRQWTIVTWGQESTPETSETVIETCQEDQDSDQVKKWSWYIRLVLSPSSQGLNISLSISWLWKPLNCVLSEVVKALLWYRTRWLIVQFYANIHRNLLVC